LSESGSVTRIPLQVSRQCVVASIQVDLSEEVLDQFRIDLLELIGSSGANGVILDLSGVEVMDFQDFDALRRTIAMARLMGSRTVLSGLKAGVVSSLVELEADTEDIVAALDLDDAFRVMEDLRSIDRDMNQGDDGE
jgi:rsbT antagonist protein RsbS